MNDKKADSAPLILLFIPVYIAIGSLIQEFNFVDFTYLLLVIIIFTKYYIKTRKKSL